MEDGEEQKQRHDDASSCPANITHVIFDMDGLLLDTEKFYTVSQEKILSNYGKTFDWSLKAKMMGKKALDAGQIFVKETGLEGILSAEEFIKQREAILHDLFPWSELMPGVERLVLHLHACRVPMAIATSSHRRHFDLKTLKHQELLSHMHHVVVGDDPAVKHGKPAPDIFLAAAQQFQDPNLKPHQILVFEDAPTGVEAARAADMHVVMVPDENLDKTLCKRADQVLSSLLDFKPSDWGLRPF
ncbi:hypothetical protein O6H91_09G052400 [Diphasiastrum complanatum]|uniref:Uncharacterized protein n=1 Tax=Diphasiastrum complanatum TaxID=34168 RepID=A0ACC2CP17_DIPCM|nr:hypothetical protein O6H91_09G052400 [Diphasiastrum complanatum]